MVSLSPAVIARALAAIATRTMACPFCGAAPEHLFPYEEGPLLELHEGPVGNAISEGAFMRHRVYCGHEDRNFAVVYRPQRGLPTCPSCESAFDVVADPPSEHFILTPTFAAVAYCAGCGEEDLGSVTYEAFDIRDEGLLGN
jgi:hypothetical protein